MYDTSSGGILHGFDRSNRMLSVTRVFDLETIPVGKLNRSRVALATTRHSLTHRGQLSRPISVNKFCGQLVVERIRFVPPYRVQNIPSTILYTSPSWFSFPCNSARGHQILIFAVSLLLSWYRAWSVEKCADLGSRGEQRVQRITWAGGVWDLERKNRSNAAVGRIKATLEAALGPLLAVRRETSRRDIPCDLAWQRSINGAGWKSDHRETREG